MYRPPGCISLAFLLVLTATAFVSHRAEGQTNGDALSPDNAADKTSYTITGTVVNSATGEPISRALVQMSPSEFTVAVNPSTQQLADAINSRYRQRVMLTDREGRFKFEGLAPMKIMFNVRKPGFFGPNELSEGGLQSASPRVEVGPETPPVVLKLVPEAIITGHVTDANGEPLEGVTLRVSGVQHMNGRRQLQPMLQDQEEPQTWATNEDGEYRVAGLAPGSYYISAVPYSANHDQAQSLGIPKVAFPVTYYPGAAELNDATPLQLSAGQRAEIDFTIRPVPVIVIAGGLNGAGRAQDIDLEFSNQSGDDVSLDKQVDSQTGTFQAHVIAGGPCVIKAEAKDALERPLHAQVTVNATVSVRNVRLNLEPALSIPIAVRVESTRSYSSSAEGATAMKRDNFGSSIPVSVNLHPIEMGRPELSASVEGGPNNPFLVLRNLEPGRYKVEAIPNNTTSNAWYVKSISYGGADLLRQELTVAPGQAAAMEIVLRDDSAILHGTVQSGEEDEGQTVAVLVVPDYAPLDAKMIVANDRGEFQLDGLAPGDYKVFAFDRLDGLEYSNPETLDQYASRAAQVSLQPNEKTTVKVDLIQRGE
jgi:protocatechuate 3,4-dioxygenase beta subunit